MIRELNRPRIADDSPASPPPGTPPGMLLGSHPVADYSRMPAPAIGRTAFPALTHPGHTEVHMNRIARRLAGCVAIAWLAVAGSHAQAQAPRADEDVHPYLQVESGSHAAFIRRLDVAESRGLVVTASDDSARAGCPKVASGVAEMEATGFSVSPRVAALAVDKGLNR